MSLKEVKELEKNKHQITISVDRETFNTAVNKVYKKQVKNITVPGFRRGKAPRAIIEKMYGSGVFYEDAINDILPEAYEEAAKESGLDIVGRPEFDIETIDENGVVITAVVYVKPEVKLEGYKGLPAVKTPVVVEDGEVDAEIDRARERNARISDVTDRAAADGDICDIDFEGFVDGVAFEGGKAEGHELTLGSHQFIEGFEEQIVGKNIGDEFDVNVTFPAEYHAEELAGKPAVFKVKLNSIKVKELPEVDDEFASMASEFDTIDEYKADIKAKITERKEKAADSDVENQLIDALVDKLEADIPECMFDEETENCVRDMDNNLRMQGLDLSTYLKYTGMDLDGVRAEMRPRAVKQVKVRLALEKVAELEGIEVTDEDVDEEITKIAEAYRMEAEEVKKLVPVDGVKADIKVRKAVELIKNAAAITDKKADETEEKAEEKPKAKKTTTRKSTAKKAADESKEGEDAEKPAAKKTTKKSTTTKKTTSKAKKTSEDTEA